MCIRDSRIGNLRIYYRDKNSGRQNTAISLKEYSHFNLFEDIQRRSDDLANKLFDICLPQPEVDLTRIQKVNRKKMDLSMPKMDKLIEFNMVKPGDRLYITLSSVDREDSMATLLDAKYVRYKNEKMTLNQWGCRVTGWKSIRIYAWAAKEGEIETLQEKRLAYVQEHNEAVK